MDNPQASDHLVADSTPLLPDAPPLAVGPTPRQLRAAYRLGRRDAATLRPDAEGHLPSTRAFAAEADRVEAHIHAALIAAVEKIDARVARIEADLNGRDKFPSPTPSPHEVQDPRAGSPEAQNAARNFAAGLARAAASDAAVQARLKDLGGSAAELLQRRRHLHEAASSILQGWQARCKVLTETHRAGYAKALARRFPRPRLTVPDIHLVPTPAHEAGHDWAVGRQLPFTATTSRQGESPGLIWEILNEAP